jgi:diadenosine tetraphosphatase ApaH/serine/threonine PP2A family protein phosphatase
MRVAVVSDIHGNIHALAAVLQALADDDVGELWCLGDLVGYGPRPNECCAAVDGRASVCLVGNHDLLALDGAAREGEFNPDAAEAGRWTRSVLDGRSRAFLEKLPSQAEVNGAQLFHGSPRDPVWDYVLSREGMVEALELTSEPLVLVGHSHVPFAFSAEGELAFGPGLAGAEAELAGLRWVLNPGSVGQPRDADPRASYLVLDLTARRAFFRRVAYDVERTQREIREAGLPETLAARLATGV